MWAEARKQEKKVRGIMVDHKKRAERRREYYEKIKQDPAQFLQINGRSCKLHIDSNPYGKEPSNTIMPWQGNAEILIDRFDVRAHLDFIPEVRKSEAFPDEAKDMRPTNYERYRILIQNNFLKVKEEKFLKTIAMEEKYGGKTYQQQKASDDKKKAALQNKAAIGFTYDDSTGPVPAGDIKSQADIQDPIQSDSDEEFDFDTVVNLSALSRDQQHDLNGIGRSFFLGREDFVKFLKEEVEEQEMAKTVKQEEDEKSAFSGRKSRKERRILKEKRLAGRIPSPPSYATFNEHGDPKPSRYHSSSEEDSSRSPSPEAAKKNGKVEYITTFGDDFETAKKKRGGGRRGASTSSRGSKRKARSSSSSSSSDNERRGDNNDKYRSKYRRKRRSSSSSSSGPRSEAIQPPPPPPVKRYYGRRCEESEDEDVSSDDVSSELKTESSSQMYSRANANAATKTTATASSGGGGVAKFKEKLKKRMQIQLQKHYKADKKAEIDRKLKAEEARVVREEELKEIMKKVKARRPGSDSLSNGSEDDSNVPLQRPNLRRRSSSGRSSRSHSPTDDANPISNRRRSRSRERKRSSLQRDDRRSRSRERRYRRSRDRSRERDRSSRAGGGSGDRYRRY